MRSRGIRRLLAAVSVLFLLAATVSASIKGDWQKATRVNTIGAYQEFLGKHPNSEFAAEAKSRIQKLTAEQAIRIEKVLYDVAARQDTAGAYEFFIERNPNSQLVAAAKAKLEEKLAQLRTLRFKSVALRSASLGETGPVLESTLKQQLVTLGLEVVPPEAAGYDAALVLSDLESGRPRVSKGEVVMFSMDLSGQRATPTAYAYLVTVDFQHKQAGGVFRRQVFGEVVGGGLFGLDTRPESEDAKSLRRETLIANVTSAVALRFVSYFGRERFRPAVPALLEQLKSGTFWQEKVAIKLLEEIGGKEAATGLVEIALKNDTNTIRSWACDALGAMKDENAVPALIDRLQNDEALVQQDAARALGSIKDRRAVEPLISALGHKWKDLVETAAAALKQITGQDFGTDAKAWLEWQRQKD